MYRIVIGDDDPVFLRELEDTVQSCHAANGLKRGEDFEIASFQSPDALMDALLHSQEHASLLLLDIEFGTSNGLEMAARLRERDEEFGLVYITAHDDYVLDSFDTHPLYYLLKPPQKEKLAALLREDYCRGVREGRLSLKAGERRLSLLYRDIYSVEATQHRVFLHTANSSVNWPGTLSALAPQLPRWCFCQCHPSCFINLSHVTELLPTKARMDNRTVIPVSKRFYKSAFYQYLSLLQE